jgi:hypothetical protein
MASTRCATHDRAAFVKGRMDPLVRTASVFAGSLGVVPVAEGRANS